MPTEFAGNTANSDGPQLLVLRREWDPPADLDLAKPPPRAVIPFTTSEAPRYQDAWARSVGVSVETTNSLGIKLRLIPAGGFDRAGLDLLDGFGKGGYPTALSRPLYAAAHEVTISQFQKFVEATRYETSAELLSEPGTERFTWRSPGIVQDGDQHPVVRVSWQDAQAFCHWLSETEKESYRLPTVAEWAFVARAGLGTTVRIKPPVNARWKFFDTTSPVGQDSANPFGLHDLFGNVGGWVSHPNSEKQSAQHGFAFGGCFRSATSSIHFVDWLILRSGLADTAHADDIGFRVVREISKEAKPPVESETPVKPNR
jgi:formylglycine-generating enzyme required for sulfatase activity